MPDSTSSFSYVLQRWWINNCGLTTGSHQSLYGWLKGVSLTHTSADRVGHGIRILATYAPYDRHPHKGEDNGGWRIIKIQIKEIQNTSWLHLFWARAIIETLILQIYHNEANVLVSLKSLNLPCTLTPLTRTCVHTHTTTQQKWML